MGVDVADGEVAIDVLLDDELMADCLSVRFSRVRL